jgi:hypothetical protein
MKMGDPSALLGLGKAIVEKSRAPSTLSISTLVKMDWHSSLLLVTTFEDQGTPPDPVSCVPVKKFILSLQGKMVFLPVSRVLRSQQLKALVPPPRWRP